MKDYYCLKGFKELIVLQNKNKKFAFLFFLLLLIFSLSSCSDSARFEGFLVFGSNRSEKSEVFILENGKMKLLNSRGHYPYVSPDGKFIVCSKNEGKGQEVFGFEIFDKNGRVKSFIRTTNVSGKFAWVGDDIYYVTTNEPRGNYHVLNKYDVKNEKHETVFEFDDTDWILTFDVSPDEKNIIFTVSISDTMKSKGTYLFDVNTKQSIELDRSSSCVWYPDGKNVFCITYPEKDKHEIGTYWGHFTKYNIETGEKEYLARVPFFQLTGLEMSKDGKWVYYAGPNSIYMSPIDDLTKRERITEPVRTRSGLSQDRNPDWYQGQ